MADYQSLLDNQVNPWLSYLATLGYSPSDLSQLTPQTTPATLTPAQVDSVLGAGYSDQPLYHEAFPGYDGTLQSAIQYSDAQMNANKNAGLTNLGLALAGGVTGGLLSQAGLASDASSFAGSPETAVGGSQTFGDGTVLSALNGTPPIYGAPIDVAGNVIGPTTAFGTSSIPYDAITAGLGSAGLGSAGTAAGAGSGSASNLFSGGADPNAPPDLAAPGEQTPGGYDTEIPNLGTTSGIPSWLQSLLPYSSLIGGGLGLLDSLLQPKSTTTTQGGTSQSTQTGTIQLPSQITGAAGTALDRANQLLTQGPQFGATPYILNQAAGRLADMGSNTAPLTSSFADGQNINPYLDMEFNAAANATQNRLGSEFANAGQYGSPQNVGARSNELQTLAAGIYGPGYENAVNRQYGAQEAGVSRGLQQQDSNLNRNLQAVNAALPIGQYLQQRADTQANAPYTGLNQYISQIGALSPFYPGTTQQSQATTQQGNVTQPVYNNPIANVLGGAQLGSYYGNLLGQQQGQNMTIQPANLQQAQQMQIQPWGGYNQYAY